MKLQKYRFMPMLAGILALGVGVSSEATNSGDTSGFIRRLAADFFEFDGSEFSTSLTAVVGPDEFTPGPKDGFTFFTKKVKVPWDSNTLYVSIYTTGDAHGGAALWMSCRVDGNFCRPSKNPKGIDQAPSGWIALLKVPTSAGTNNCDDGGGGPADCHDNSIAYQWCVQLPKKTWKHTGWKERTVELKLATDTEGQSVFIEKGHVYIDSSKIHGDNRCTPVPGEGPPNGP
jgi:hypothetical protein